MKFSPRNSEGTDSLEATLQMSADGYRVPLAEIGIQDTNDEDCAYRLWTYPNQMALELPMFLFLAVTNGRRTMRSASHSVCHLLTDTERRRR